MAGKKKTTENEQTETRGRDDAHAAFARAAVYAFSAFGKLADRVGISLAVTGFLFAMVWLFGSEKTKDDFIRELLFNETNRYPVLSVFFASLILNGIFIGSGMIKKLTVEKKEFKRMAAEKARLQELLLNRTLPHSEPALAEIPAIKD